MRLDIKHVYCSRDPLVSIITPSLNQGRFIRQTITSVLTQDYPNIEYWVVDGGSTDETVAILREYDHDPRFHWISEPDDGQSDAINKGLAHCHGELFSWLNADNVLMPGALQRIAAAYHAATAPTIVYGLARLIDQDGRDIGYCAGQSARASTLARARPALQPSAARDLRADCGYSRGWRRRSLAALCHGF